MVLPLSAGRNLSLDLFFVKDFKGGGGGWGFRSITLEKMISSQELEGKAIDSESFRQIQEE